MTILVSLKLGVKVNGLKPEALLGIFIAKSVFEFHGESVMVITSVTDGQHKTGSLHYKGQAFDLRLPRNNISSIIVAGLREALHSDFDVVLEIDHIHVEYDPK